MVARDAGAFVAPVHFRDVGRARARAAFAALDSLGGAPDGVWIASTDADSTVPPDWRAFQPARAQEGWDALERTGARILRTPDYPVTASARMHPRDRGGFGDYLAKLDRLAPFTLSGIE